MFGGNTRRWRWARERARQLSHDCQRTQKGRTIDRTCRGRWTRASAWVLAVASIASEHSKGRTMSLLHQQSFGWMRGQAAKGRGGVDVLRWDSGALVASWCAPGSVRGCGRVVGRVAGAW
jgi:hypothetical protein